MVAGKTTRLSKLARQFNVGIHTIVEFLHKKGYEIDSNPNTKVAEDAVQLLEKEYKVDITIKKESEKMNLKSQRPKKAKRSVMAVIKSLSPTETTTKTITTASINQNATYEMANRGDFIKGCLKSIL